MNRSHTSPSGGGCPQSKSRRSRNGEPAVGQFESLEPRMVLNGTAVIENGALVVQGDAEDNAIDVTVTGDTVKVTCDGQDLQSFAGLGSDFTVVKVEAGAGNDTVTVQASDAAIEAGQNVRIAVDGGEGDDAITINAQNTQVAAEGEEGGSLRVAVHGGRGADAIDLAIEGLTVAENARLAVDVQGNTGDDTIALLAKEANLDGNVWVSLDLGLGDDTLDASIEDLAVAQTGKVSFGVRGGPGDDNATLHASEATIEGLLTTRIDGGFGQDSFDLTTNNVTIDGTVQVGVNGGPGDDAMTLAGSGIIIHGTVRGRVDGGPGRDTLTDDRAADAVALGPQAVVDVKVHPGPQRSQPHKPGNSDAPREDDHGLPEDLEAMFHSLRRRMARLNGRFE